MLTNAHEWSSGTGVGSESLGAGFESQEPNNFHNILLQVIVCRLASAFHHMPSSIELPCVLESRSDDKR